MWPFKSKSPTSSTKGELQADLAAMDIQGGKIALMFEIPDENESRYWIIEDPQVILAISDGQADIEPKHFFSAVDRVPDADPQLPELVWLLDGRELKGAYNLSDRRNFTQTDAERFLKSLGPKAARVEWFEPHLRGRREIEAMQERLWVEEDIFALAELPDTSDMCHDFTHAFRLRLPPTDMAPAGHSGVVQDIVRLFQKAFPGSDDLYVLGRIYFAPVAVPTAIAVRGAQDMNSTKHKKIDAPST